MIRFVTALSLCLSLAACGTPLHEPYYGESGIPGFADAESAFRWSADNDHLLLVFFTSASCADCWAFQSEVLVPLVQESPGDFALLSLDYPGIPLEGFSLERMRAERDRDELSERYRRDRRGLPDLVVVDPVSRELVLEGRAPREAGAFAVYLEEARSRAGVR